MTENGQVDSEAAAAGAADTPKRIRLDPDELTPGDLKRARVALDGRNPWELLEDPLDGIILTIWCFKSRTDPGFTFEQAEATPLGEFEMGDATPPPTPGPVVNGASPGKNDISASAATPAASATAPL